MGNFQDLSAYITQMKTHATSFLRALDALKPASGATPKKDTTVIWVLNMLRNAEDLPTLAPLLMSVVREAITFFPQQGTVMSFVQLLEQSGGSFVAKMQNRTWPLDSQTRAHIPFLPLQSGKLTQYLQTLMVAPPPLTNGTTPPLPAQRIVMCLKDGRPTFRFSWYIVINMLGATDLPTESVRAPWEIYIGESQLKDALVDLVAIQKDAELDEDVVGDMASLNDALITNLKNL
jgi:hypothetical protein